MSQEEVFLANVVEKLAWVKGMIDKGEIQDARVMLACATQLIDLHLGHLPEIRAEKNFLDGQIWEQLGCNFLAGCSFSDAAKACRQAGGMAIEELKSLRALRRIRAVRRERRTGLLLRIVVLRLGLLLDAAVKLYMETYEHRFEPSMSVPGFGNPR